jgi:ferredoxin
MAGSEFTGNNQQVLLEQLEQQGIRVPYSCRAGFAAAAASAGRRRSQRVEENAVAADGTILCCSCVPKTAVKLAP